MQAQVLAPAAVLVLWSLVMLFWTAGSRFPAMKKLGAGLGSGKPGGRGQDLEGVIPDQANWKSHNYTHLMEQPTIFYPTVVIIAIMGPTAHDVLFAWAYVVIRIIHSLWQATVNTLPVRFSLFLLSTLCLVMLALHAAKLTLFAV
jgi:hypothetical protein